ncbi:MAG: DHH family phosphoesterase [Coriobacteriales bacterium]|jgi:phosphoesterase RecJ-like protein|nr:DHH family phosphoesterase [Coriobacteriales bacterium]
MSLSPEEALKVMEGAQSIAIAGHVNPDGDAIGSALALRSLLRALGKDAVVLLGQDSAAPELYRFLPEYEFVRASEYSGVPDLFIVVDASTAKRLGTSERILGVARDTLVIDHHSNYEGFANHYIGDATAPAAATVIWRIIKASGIKPTLAMATYCYVGIMTDTGRFAFRNTNASAFADATEMIGIGVDPARMSELVYENRTLSALRLEALMIDRIQFSGGGSVAYSFILEDDLRALGLERDATEQLPATLRAIKGVEVAALFRDEGTKGIHASLRSRNTFNVGAFASRFGGGGHAGAAGLTLKQPLDEVISLVVSGLASELSARLSAGT